MQFKVQKMGCGGCAKTISDAIHAVDPGAQVDVDLASKRVAVTSHIDQTALQQIMSGAGFPAEHIA